MCRECIRLPENRDKVHLNIIRNDFIFSVESTGCVSAKVLVPKVGVLGRTYGKALAVLKEKCKTIIRELDSIENGIPTMEEEEIPVEDEEAMEDE